jgi:hypothetical protein
MGVLPPPRHARQPRVMRVMNLCLIFLFVSVSAISFLGREIPPAGSAGRWIPVFVAGSWFWRALLRAAFFGIRKPVSVLFIVLFPAGFALVGLLAPGFLLS